MSEQHFCGHIDGVAARDNIDIHIEHQHLYSSERRLQLGGQKWATKYYVLGTSITAVWLAFFLFLSFTGFIAFAGSSILSAIQSFVTHDTPPGGLVICLRLVISVAIAPIAVAAVQISFRGFLGIPCTQSGIVRDTNGHVFIGRLGGEGSFCPLCREKLHFHTLGPSPILRCTRNTDHWWTFDFTRVSE